jgi:hypothetical protein
LVYPQVADACYRSLEHLDSDLLSTLTSQVDSTMDKSDNRDMKEVKGLSERLLGMENLIRGAIHQLLNIILTLRILVMLLVSTLPYVV